MRLARFLLVLALLAGLPVVADGAGADTLVARGSVNQVQVSGATPGATVELHRDGGPVLATGTVDARGAFIFGIDPGTQDDVPRGSGYTVEEVGGDTVPVTAPTWASVEVVGPDDTPPQSFYEDQSLPVPAYSTTQTPTGDAGYGYITTRDGTTLSANVLAPFNIFGPSPTYPTVVIYSGYEPSAPNVQGDPDDAIGTILRFAGYAVVSVNIRGTGCSGGAYSYWEPLQGLDGYDVIEAVAAQPWARVAPANAAFDDGGPMIGMAGISFGGISQLFTAATDPPSLAGITPLSVIADTYRSTLYPGGIGNDGFARDWAAGREQQAEPSGSPWSAQRIANGDTTCEANQELKLQAPPIVARFTQDLLYQADPGDALAPETFVDDIEVPTFISGSFQDEQTGGHWSTMLSRFDPDVLKRATLFNGTHADPLGPDGIRDLLEFLDLYVARRAPQANNLLRAEIGPSMRDVFGADYALAPNRAATVPNQVAYEVEDPVVLRWERGARDSAFCRVDTNTAFNQLSEEPCEPDGEGDGAPFARFESTFGAWPPPDATDARWFLQPDGRLLTTGPDVPAGEPRGLSSFRYETDPGRTQDTIGVAGGDWDKDTTYTWTATSERDSLRFVTDPMTTTRAFAGRGSARLWIRANATDVDLEITLTEVRPDGQELYVQGGWLRASNRAEAPGSGPLAPRHTHLAHQPLPADQFVPVRIELLPFAALVRPGSRLALTVSAPGGNRTLWQFDSPDDDDATVVDVAHAVGRRSQLDLPEVTPPPAAPASLPVCGDLRSQPCRDTPESTRPTGVDIGLFQGLPQATDRHRFVQVEWEAPEAPGVTGYEITDLVTGETYQEDAADERLVIEVPEHRPPPAGRHAYRVTALYGMTPGQPSSASAVRPGLGALDVPATAWNAEAVGWMHGWRLLPQATGSLFRNGEPITRLSFVIWLFNAFGAPSAQARHTFVDVGGRASNALSWAQEAGIVTGLPGNRFGPDRRISRAQLTQWLWVAAGRPPASAPNGFVDVPTGAWYAPAVDWAREAGAVAGFPGNRFRPGANATRGQAAVWLMATAAWLSASD